MQAFFLSFFHEEEYPVPMSSKVTVPVFRGCDPYDHMERGSLPVLSRWRLSAMPLTDCGPAQAT